MTHTKEPWRIDPIYNCDIETDSGVHQIANTHPKALAGPHKSGECIDNAARIVECVNACAGLNPAAIPDVVDAAIRLSDDVQDLIDGSKDCGDPNYECPMQDAYNPDSTLERLNDLLRALAKLQVQS